MFDYEIFNVSKKTFFLEQEYSQKHTIPDSFRRLVDIYYSGLSDFSEHYDCLLLFCWIIAMLSPTQLLKDSSFLSPVLTRLTNYMVFSKGYMPVYSHTFPPTVHIS